MSRCSCQKSKLGCEQALTEEVVKDDACYYLTYTDGRRGSRESQGDIGQRWRRIEI